MTNDSVIYKNFHLINIILLLWCHSYVKHCLQLKTLHTIKSVWQHWRFAVQVIVQVIFHFYAL